MSSRKPLITVQTPYPGASTVVLYSDTQEYHIPENRKQDLDKVITTLETPTIVVRGTTNPSYVLFVNLAVVSPGSKSPFGVVVDPSGDPLPVVASYSYRNSFLKPGKYVQIWPTEGEDDDKA